MPRYLITNGDFRLDDGRLAGPGETIELGEDIAALHTDKVTLVTEAPDLADAGDAHQPA